MTSAVAGGTGDAITIPTLPCVPTTTLLILTASYANTTTAPTISYPGGSAQPIVQNTGAALLVGQLAAGGRYMLSSNGQKWFMLTAAQTVPTGDLKAASIFNPLAYGAACNSAADSAPAVQAAVNAAAGGGTVLVPCPLTFATQVTLSSSVRLSGVGGPIGYAGMQDTPGPSVWPPTGGPAINCTSTTVTACVMVLGAGVEIDHILFGNPQPAVPTTCGTPCNNWTPTLFPFVIGTTNNSGWQGLHLNSLSCTACSQFIDLEGTPDYTTFSGNQITLRDLWCNACLNIGLRLHRIDNALLVSHFDFVAHWNANRGPLGYYQRQNLIGLDIQYAAAPQFDNLNFAFGMKSAIQLTNATVVNNFGSLTFAASAVQMTNVMFNQVCQAITIPGGNGTSTPGQIALTNVFAWGDQSGFNCSAGKPFFDLRSNFINMSMSQIGIAYVDTFAAIGCGAPGTGSCPAGSGAGGASLRLNDVDTSAGEYSHFTAGQPFITAPAGAYVSFGVTDMAAIHAASGAGNIMAPGLDGTQAYMAPLFVGGSGKPIEGAVALEGSGSVGMGSTGFVGFWVPAGTQQGYVGGCTTGTGGGCSLAANSGKIFLKPEYTSGGNALMSVDSVGAQLRVNVSGLPTSCTGQVTGTLWVNGVVVQVCT